MAVSALIALLVASLASAGIAAGVSAANNAKNIEAQNKANQDNIAFQREINARNQYNMEHAHQIEMADLQAAGLNPVLTATGGSGAAIQKLEAPSVNQVKSDISGVTNAIAGFGNTMQSLMMFSLMSDMRKELSQAHNDTLLAMSGDRNAVLSGLYRRKAQVYNEANSASSIASKTKNSGDYQKQWKELLKALS